MQKYEAKRYAIKGSIIGTTYIPMLTAIIASSKIAIFL